MRETTKQTLAILFITIILGISIFIFLKFTQPMFNNLTSLKTQIIEKQEVKKGLLERKAMLQDIADKYQLLGGDLTKINYALPTKPQLAEVLATIDVIAKQAQVNLNEVSFREINETEAGKKNTNSYNTIEVTFAVEGNFVNTNLFLQEVGQELRIMDVKQVAMKQYNTLQQVGSKTKSYKTISILKTDVVLYTYYQP